MSETKQDFNFSKGICQYNQLNLAIIPNEAVNEEVSKYITNELRGTTDNKVWIGVNDKETEGVFKNSDGSSITYTNWYKSNTNNTFENEPNDPMNPGIASQDCVTIDKEGKWFDETCTKSYRALCYKALPTLPPTSTTLLTTSTTLPPTSTTLPPTSTTLPPTSTATNQETTRVRISTSTFSMPPSNEQSSDTQPTMFLTSTYKQTSLDKNVSITDATRVTESTNTSTREERDQKDKLLIPVIIAVSVVFLLFLIIVVICIARKRISRKTDKCEPPLEKKKGTREDEYDVLHKNKLNVENTESSNFYDHTNMNSELYDTAIQNKINSDLDGIHIKQQRAQNYDISSVAVLEKDNVYYSSAKFKPDGDDVYGETNEGEYDVLNKRRNKQELVKDQIYSHTGTDETEYDLTVRNPNQNMVNDDTYDSTRNTTKDNTYDTMTTR